MSKVHDWLGAHLPKRLYYLARGASLAYEHRRPRDFDPASLTAREPLDTRHFASTTVLPDREALLAHIPQGGVAVEVGVDRGDFSAAILRIAAPHRLHLVDNWASARYGADERAAVQQRFAAEGERVEIHLTDSVSGATDFAADSLDFVYIDTTHSCELTLTELEAYRLKMAPGGLLAGHDYIIGNWHSRLRYRVIEAVHDFCLRYGWRLRYLTNELPAHPSFALEPMPVASSAR